jgi:hypothetical protein
MVDQLAKHVEGALKFKNATKSTRAMVRIKLAVVRAFQSVAETAGTRDADVPKPRGKGDARKRPLAYAQPDPAPHLLAAHSAGTARTNTQSVDAMQTAEGSLGATEGTREEEDDDASEPSARKGAPGPVRRPRAKRAAAVAASHAWRGAV